MTKQSALSALAFATVLACGTVSEAAPIFVQMTVPPTAEFFSDSHHENGELTADDFVLGASATILSVSWQGANSSAGAPGPDSFRINIYSDPLNMSSLIRSFSAGPAIRTDTGTTIGDFGDILYNYSADLNGGFFATAGTRYWISIVNDAIVADHVNDWTWAGTFNGAGFGSTDNGATWLLQASQTNFALNDTPVPEPATLTLVCLGLLGIVRARKHAMSRR